MINHFISDHKAHAYNQNRNPNKKLWDLMLDNQSTCDVIINSQMLSSIRKCGRTLRLQKKAGECVANKVGELSGVGTA